MFTLADNFTFEADPTMCSLVASAGFADSACLSWNLKLHSMAAYTSLIPPEERGPGYDKVAFGLEFRDLAFKIADWKQLAQSTVEVPEVSLSCAFIVFDWEDLSSLSLRFGPTRRDEIEVFADGVGGAESIPDLFPDSKVSFSVHTWARFLGVSINVPVNAGDFSAYAHKQLRSLLPGFAYGEPAIRRAVNEAGDLRGVEVFYTPL
jgi:hypothetical protein